MFCLLGTNSLVLALSQQSSKGCLWVYYAMPTHFDPKKLHDGVQVFCKVYKFYVYVWNRKLSPLVAQHANTAGYWGGTKTSCVLGLAKLALLVFFWAHKYLNRQATLIDITTWPQFIGLFVVWGPVPFYKSSTTYFVYSKVFCMLKIH